MTTLTPPTSISSDLLPTIVNLDEARERCHDFASVLTAGPSLDEVCDFAHPEHKVVEFDDVTSAYSGYTPPTFDQVEEMVRGAKVASIYSCTVMRVCRDRRRRRGASQLPTGSTRKRRSIF